MKMHLVLFVVVLIIVNTNSYPETVDLAHQLEKQGHNEVNGELKRRQRRADDYDDEGGFVLSQGKPGDDDFIANASQCPAGYVRTPWGSCVTCSQYYSMGLGKC